MLAIDVSQPPEPKYKESASVIQLSFIMITKYLINLDHRSDRLDQFTQSWHKNGFDLSDISRISASHQIDFGGLGCAKSHLRALTTFLTSSDDQHCMILEDDFEWNTDRSIFYSIFSGIIERKSNYNVFLLAGTNVVTGDQESTQSECHEIFESSTTSGYIVNKHYVPTLIKIFADSVFSMEKYKSANQRALIYDRFAIDQVWKHEQRKGNWYAKIPMLGKQRVSYSDIENKIVDYSEISS